MNKLILILLISTSGTAFSQEISLSQLKEIVTQKKASLEVYEEGMSLKSTTFTTQEGCDFKVEDTSTILKLQGETFLNYLEAKYYPSRSRECRQLGYNRATSQRVLSFEPRETVSSIHLGLDQMQPSKIVLNGNLVSIFTKVKVPNADGTTSDKDMETQMDLSGSYFQSLRKTEVLGVSKIESEVVSKINPNSLDLSDVIFCEDLPDGRQNCVPGDYSDILN